MKTIKNSFYNSFFYIGWRPTLGWVGTIAVIIQFIISPIFFFITNESLSFNLDTIALVTLVLTHTGIRTYEKINMEEG